MTLNRITQQIASQQMKLKALRKERNDLIIARYKELYNIETWHKLKAEYVYATIGKESGINTSLVKKVILLNK